MDDFKETVIEFLRDEKRATVSFTQGRYISRIKELAKRKPDDCQIVRENPDGTLTAHIPTSWIKINPTRELSEEQLEKYRERVKAMNVSKHDNTRCETD